MPMLPPLLDAADAADMLLADACCRDADDAAADAFITFFADDAAAALRRDD